MKIGNVYYAKSYKSHQRLRVRIDGRVYYCGKHIPHLKAWISSISMDNEVVIQFESGLIKTYKNGKEIE